MDKLVRYIFVFLICFLINTGVVHGYAVYTTLDEYDSDYEMDCVKDETCVIACRYKNNFCKWGFNKYNIVHKDIYIYYDLNKKNYYALWIQEHLSKEGGATLYQSNDLEDSVDISQEDKVNLVDSSNRKCPALGFVRNDGKGVCFGSQEFCESKTGFFGNIKYKAEDEDKSKMCDADAGTGNTGSGGTGSGGTGDSASTEKIEDNAGDIPIDPIDLDITSNKNFKNCEDVLGGNVLRLVNKFFKYIYILVPILVLVLGFVDFGKAVLASKPDDMNKAKGRFIKRVIMGIAVFLVPTIINITFYVADFAKNPDNPNNFFNYIKGDICVND